MSEIKERPFEVIMKDDVHIPEGHGSREFENLRWLIRGQGNLICYTVVATGLFNIAVLLAIIFLMWERHA
jgi:hypothetical protein